jgi:hypothetical protein
MCFGKEGAGSFALPDRESVTPFDARARVAREPFTQRLRYERLKWSVCVATVQSTAQRILSPFSRKAGYGFDSHHRHP